jgi:hypothetical protein
MTFDRPPGARSVQFIDVIVAAVEHWKVLLGLPILVGGLAYMVASSQPSVFEAKATLHMIADREGSMFSRELVERALKGTTYAANTDAVIPALTVNPYIHVVGYVVKRPVSLTWNSSQATYDILQAVVLQYQREFLEKVRSEYLASYQHQIDMGDVEIKDRTSLREKLAADLDGQAGLQSNAQSKSAVIVALTTSIEERQRLKSDLLTLAKSLPVTLIVDPVKAPIFLGGSRPVAEAIGSAMGALVMIVLYLALAERIKLEALTPSGMQKMARIQRAFIKRA